MKSFAYARAADLEAAVKLLSKTPNAKLLGGGTNLVDLMRENIEQPDALVDVTGLPLDRIEERPDGGLVIGATVRNTAVAGHPVVRDRYPLLAQAIVFGASGQIRNMATVAGNLMQRTRCLYFYDHAARCNKRAPGAGCDAIGGFNRMHAILGASDSCIATHPSDMCVALAALDAKVNVIGPSGARTIAFEEFHRLPEDTPDIETDLQPGATHNRHRDPAARLCQALALQEGPGPRELCFCPGQRGCRSGGRQRQGQERPPGTRRRSAQAVAGYRSRARSGGSERWRRELQTGGGSRTRAGKRPRP